MGFFEPPPTPQIEPDDDDEGFGAPTQVLGGPIPLRALLARSENFVLAIGNGTAYPTGFEVVLSVRARRRWIDGRDLLHAAGMSAFDRERWRDGTTIPDEFLRFGIEYAGGTRATNLDGFSHDLASDAPRMTPQGGHGSGKSWDQRYWIAPLPPPGTLGLVCEWPAAGIPLTRLDVDASLVRDAADEAVTLWER